MRKIKYIVTWLLIIVLGMSVAACGKTQKEQGKGNQSKNTHFGQVWSTSATNKIQQNDIAYADKEEPKLSYKVVRNEYESAQLLITADKKVSRFELKASDLKSEDSVLSAENITVYMQKYIQFSDYYGEDLSMPDALLPMKTADEYKENSIEAGKNGALWITVYVPKETEAGIYTGTFELILEGKNKTDKLDIPVSIEVYDYTLTDEVTAQTLFSWRYDRVAAGELDASNEMMTTYYEFFKDYRISLQSMPLEGLTGEEFAENVLKYYDEISTYSLLRVVGDISIPILSYRDRLVDQILSVAAVCPEDKNLFDKAIAYPQDEPDLRNEQNRINVLNTLNELNALFEECVQIIDADTTGKYATFKTHSDWKDSIRDITLIIPTIVVSVKWLLENQNTPEGKEILDAYDCICPAFGNFTEGGQAAIRALCEKFDIKLWWYGCTGPKAPAPTYHIGDSNLLSARTVSWLQYNYNVEGNLYWDAAAYTDEASGYYNQYINIYEVPFRGSHTDWPAGDGNLSYPGAPYGLYGPLPSLRLMSIRDGMEEYEILKDVESKLEAKKDTFGADFSAKEAIRGFCQPLYYAGTMMTVDGKDGFDFDAVRTNLYNTAVALEENLGLVICDAQYNDDLLTVTYYAQEGATVFVDGNEQQPIAGRKFEYSINYNKITDVQFEVKNDKGMTKAYSYRVQANIEILNGFSDINVLASIEGTEGTEITFAMDDRNSIGAADGAAVHINVKGVITGDALGDAVFKPTVTLKISELSDVSLSELQTLYLDMILPGDSIDMTVNLCAGETKIEIGELNVPYGASSLLLDLSGIPTEQLEKVDSLSLEFANMDGEEAATYELYIDSISGQRPYNGGE